MFRPDVQSLPRSITSHGVLLSGSPPKVYPPRRMFGGHMAPLGKRCFPFFISLDPVVGCALRGKVGGLAGRLSGPGSLYAIFACAGQHHTIICGRHIFDMCTNDGKCEIRSSASPLRPICGSVQLCQPSVRIRGGTLSPGQNSWARRGRRHGIAQEPRGGRIGTKPRLWSRFAPRQSNARWSSPQTIVCG